MSEKLNYGIMPKTPVLTEGPTLQFGHNPWLLARKVTQMFIEEASDGLEILHWKEPAWYDERNGKIVEIRKPRPRSLRSGSMFYEGE